MPSLPSLSPRWSRSTLPPLLPLLLILVCCILSHLQPHSLAGATETATMPAPGTNDTSDTSGSAATTTTLPAGATCSVLNLLQHPATAYLMESPSTYFSHSVIQLDIPAFHSRRAILRTHFPFSFALVYIYTSWSSFCKDFNSTYTQIAASFPHLPAFAVNVDTNLTFSIEMKISGYPTVLVLKGGHVETRLAGQRSFAELTQLIIRTTGLHPVPSFEYSPPAETVLYDATEESDPDLLLVCFVVLAFPFLAFLLRKLPLGER